MNKSFDSKKMSPLKVYLADLRHNYLGYVSTDAMPLGIGYMKAVMTDKLSSSVDVTLFAYPDDLEKALKENLPDVLMLTNYNWNEALSMNFAKFVRQQNPDCLIVVGGPNIPIETERRIGYLEQHNYVDLYALGEGDFFATELVERFIEKNKNRKALLAEEIHSSVYNKNVEYVATDVKPRSRNLDDIPSPWLSGIMDQFFDGTLVPLYETNRGCPFSCAFCVQGTKWYQKVNVFGLDRIKEELHYIAKKISIDFPQQKMLRIADPNFGMYDRDVEIASYLGETQAEYNFPLLIDATTGKNRADNIIKTMEQVNGALVMYQAVQSLDDEVLANIQRKNIKLEAYEDLQVYIKGRGMKSSSDLILGLPGESLEKHKNSLQKIINAKTDKLNNFQAMLLQGSELETHAVRKKYGFNTKFRLLPKGYGVYTGQTVFDTEEIVVSNKDLSFDDYLEARKYHLVINVFWNFTRFKGLLKIAADHGFTPWQWLLNIAKNIGAVHTPLSALYLQFIGETESELFDSEEQLHNFYSKPENFAKLNSGEVGDNLIYKYRTLALFYYWNEVVETAVNSTISLLADNELTASQLNFLREYGEFVKYSHVFGKSKDEILSDHQRNFQYDFRSWINDEHPIQNIESYGNPTPKTILFQLSDTNKKNLKDAFEIWSFDPKSFSMFIRRIHDDWLQKKEFELTCQSV